LEDLLTEIMDKICVLEGDLPTPTDLYINDINGSIVGNTHLHIDTVFSDATAGPSEIIDLSGLVLSTCYLTDFSIVDNTTNSNHVIDITLDMVNCVSDAIQFTIPNTNYRINTLGLSTFSCFTEENNLELVLDEVRTTVCDLEVNAIALADFTNGVTSNVCSDASKIGLGGDLCENTTITGASGAFTMTWDDVEGYSISTDEYNIGVKPTVTSNTGIRFQTLYLTNLEGFGSDMTNKTTPYVWNLIDAATGKGEWVDICTVLSEISGNANCGLTAGSPESICTQLSTCSISNLGDVYTTLYNSNDILVWNSTGGSGPGFYSQNLTTAITDVVTSNCPSGSNMNYDNGTQQLTLDITMASGCTEQVSTSLSAVATSAYGELYTYLGGVNNVTTNDLSGVGSIGVQDAASVLSVPSTGVSVKFEMLDGTTSIGVNGVTNIPANSQLVAVVGGAYKVTFEGTVIGENGITFKIGPQNSTQTWGYGKNITCNGEAQSFSVSKIQTLADGEIMECYIQYMHGSGAVTSWDVGIIDGTLRLEKM